MAKEARTVLEVRKSLKVELKAFASCNDRTLKEVTNEAIERYLKEEKAKK